MYITLSEYLVSTLVYKIMSCFESTVRQEV